MALFEIGEDNQCSLKTYNGCSACVQNIGYFSETFKVGQGVHQGGPNSSFLFLICAKLLALMLRIDPQIEYCYCRKYINLLNQYADDMDTFVLNNKTCVTRLFAILDKFLKYLDSL